ncbi:MAG: hypothetical protein AABZ94_08865 [Candidatus Eisenbacteria bacterium]
MSPNDPNFWPAVTAVATVLYTLATFVLVGVTVANVLLVRRYIATNQRLVEEARKSRAAVFRPILVPVFRELEGDEKFFTGYKLRWGIENIGPGPALDVDVTIRYGRLARRLQRPMIRSGETRRVLDGEGSPRLDLRESDDFTVYLEGTCRDAYGEPHDVWAALPVADRWESPAPASEGATGADHQKEDSVG